MDDAEALSPLLSRLDVGQVREIQKFAATAVQIQEVSARRNEKSSEMIERSKRLVARTREVLDKDR